MRKQKNPLLTIGMIFRDDIRSLKRCLEALRPLRDALPCELVMADTGSVDGSREIAVRYADILFDFPWVDDFSAARNAVMDRAAGKWFLAVDSDEYLDGDISELVDFLCGSSESRAMVIVRNYVTAEMNGQYSDSWAGRLVRMSSGLRYQGRIHENFPDTGARPAMLGRTVFHHDGYVGMNQGADRKKRARNVALLRAGLAEEPENLRHLTQLIESGREEPDYLEVVRRAAALVEGKKPGWREYGPAVFRHAVFAARRLDLPELRDWIRRAEEWFPDSFFTRIDVAHTAFVDSWDREDWFGCIHYGEDFLRAEEDYRSGGNKRELSGALMMASPAWEQNLRILLASAYMKTGHPDRTGVLLERVDGRELGVSQTRNLTLALLELHAGTNLETGSLLLRLYDELCQPVPTQEQADERMAAFWELAAGSFTREYRKDREEICRPGCTLFAPLTGRHEAGTASAILDSADTAEITELLRAVERWDLLPAAALTRAMSFGVPFPLADRPLKLEEMDVLADRMAREDSGLTALAVRAVEERPEDWQGVIWARELVLAAVQSCDWERDERGMDLCRAFARIEGDVLPRYYSEALLREENIDVLPPIHRFGWYAARAFQALEAGGNAEEYVCLLRMGLASCPGMKPVVEFLLDRLERNWRRQVPTELLALAEQVRTILAAYDPSDPAVAALKASPAYQKVAYLIEGTDGGGLPS